MKKRNLIAILLFILFSGSFTACDILEECAQCAFISEDEDGNVISEGTPLPYCGDQLAEKQDTPPVTVGGVTSYWSCN